MRQHAPVLLLRRCKCHWLRWRRLELLGYRALRQLLPSLGILGTDVRTPIPCRAPARQRFAMPAMPGVHLSTT